MLAEVSGEETGQLARGWPPREIVYPKPEVPSHVIVSLKQVWNWVVRCLRGMSSSKYIFDTVVCRDKFFNIVYIKDYRNKWERNAWKHILRVQSSTTSTHSLWTVVHVLVTTCRLWVSVVSFRIGRWFFNVVTRWFEFLIMYLGHDQEKRPQLYDQGYFKSYDEVRTSRDP